MDLYTLERGVVYIVTKPFSDFHNQSFSSGDKLTFVERHFLPYHGGHTVVFKEKAIYLQEDENAVIVHSLDQYLAPYDLSGRIPPTVAPVKRQSIIGPIFGIVGSLILCAAGIWMVFFGAKSRQDLALGWAVIVFFGIATLIYARSLRKRK
jgi:hypothetical protein